MNYNVFLLFCWTSKHLHKYFTSFERILLKLISYDSLFSKNCYESLLLKMAI